MKKHFLFPSSCRKIGWFLFVPAMITAVVVRFFDLSIHETLVVPVYSLFGNDLLMSNKNAIVDELLLTLLLVGGILVGFSQLKEEDEMTQAIRYESLVWAVYVNFGVMLVAIWLIYGIHFFEVMIYNMFTVLLFFLIRFELMLRKAKIAAENEK